jgi:hypothetical protein
MGTQPTHKSSRLTINNRFLGNRCQKERWYDKSTTIKKPQWTTKYVIEM